MRRFKTHLTLLFLLYCLNSFAQLYDNFADTNFTANPAWSGDDTQFEVSTSTAIPANLRPALRLNGDAAGGVSYLSTPFNFDGSNDYEWSFWVKISFNPTSGNNARIYIVSDNSNVEGSLNGYYVAVGELGDKLSLVRQTGTTTTELISGTVANLNFTSSTLMIKVTRSSNGDWQLFSDPTGGTNFQSEGTATDATFTTGSYFGIYCKYTSSNYRNFYFDEIKGNILLPDVTPPQLTAISTISSTVLELTFDEALDITTAQTTGNYTVSGIGNPVNAQLISANVVRLTFSNAFTPNQTYSLAVTGIKDLAGNAMSLTTMPFTYTVGNPLIDEHFTDGDFTNNPKWVGSDTAYIVNTDKQLQLKTVNSGQMYLSTEFSPAADSIEWQIWIKCLFDPSTSNYPKFYLMSNQAVLNQPTNGYFIKFGETGTTDAVELYKQTGSTNSLLIRATAGMVATQPNLRIKVKYNRLNGNWQLFADYTGGYNFVLEGSANDATYNFNSCFVGPVSVFTSSNATKFYFDDIYAGPVIVDTVGPKIDTVIATSATTADVYFNENLNSISAEDETKYSVNNSIGNPTAAVLDNTNKNLVHLSFSTAFTDNTTYTLTVSGMQDESGNSTVTSTKNFIYIAYPSLIDEKFSDGDFTNNPVWTGNTANFIVNQEQKLQLKATAAGSSYLSTGVNPVADSLEWQFLINMMFDPSSSNFTKFYLASDKADLSGSLNGYYIKIGENGSLDAIELYKQSGTTSTLIARGTNGTAAVAPNIRVRVIFNKLLSQWRIYYDNSGGSNFVPDFTASDNTFSALTFFIGPSCTYTSSNMTKFIFDDIYCGSVYIDTIAPQITGVLVTGANSIDVVFNENLSATSAEEESNYYINNGMGSPTSATLDAASRNIVHLTFNSPFTDNMLYKLSCMNVADEQLNAIDSIVFNFFYRASPPYILDGFDDLEIFTNPAWDGDVGAFIVNDNYQLQLYTSGSGTSYLSTSINTNQDSLEWQIWLKFTFDPSTSNYFKYYLYSNQSNLKNTTKGYYLRIGETGSTDALELYYQDGATNTLLARGADGRFATKPMARIKVKRNLLNGEWKIYVDTLGGINFNEEASAVDTSYKPRLFYVGLVTTYSSSYSKNFYFDDIYAGPVIKDTVPPLVSDVIVTGSSSLEVYFNEPVDEATTNLIVNYTVNNGIGNPILAQRDANNKSKVLLEFGSAFQDEVLYSIFFSGITDLAGNTIIPVSKNFARYVPKEFDVLIHELMADVDPAPLSLPPKDYLELHNRTQYPLRLSGWTIQPRASSAPLNMPDFSIAPNGFVIICDDDDASAFSSYGSVLGINGFYLNNEGLVVLRNNSGKVIHQINYKSSWYNNSIKKDGGWSLEMIDPMNPCGDAANWAASNSLSGGTPGAQNSVHATNPDTKAPKLINALVLGADSVIVYFDETIRQSSLTLPTAYSIDNGIGQPIAVVNYEPDFTKVKLVLGSSLQRNTVYTLTVNNQIKDCAGNSVATANTWKFAIPEEPQAGDIIINEILFNPPTGGYDYVEVYNNSNKIIDLKSLKLSSFDTIKNEVKTVKEITTTGRLIFPQEYMVFSADTGWVKKNYYTPNPNNFVQMSMPSYNDDAGVVCLLKDSSNIIDKLYYTSKWHFPLLKNNAEGVSLERLDFNRPTQEKENWHSAAESVGFGTPAYKNSQYKVSQIANGIIGVDPEIFSPDNDGYNDVVNITYKFDTPGNVANVMIYDKNGRRVRMLAQNKLLGNEGVITWDGTDEKREKARIGIYILYFEIFDVNGNTSYFKENIVVAGKMN